MTKTIHTLFERVATRFPAALDRHHGSGAGGKRHQHLRIQDNARKSLSDLFSQLCHIQPGNRNDPGIRHLNDITVSHKNIFKIRPVAARVIG